MKTLTLALLLAAWLPGGLLAATATTSEPKLGGVRVELFHNSGTVKECQVRYINPTQVSHFIPSSTAVTDYGTFGTSCDRAATVEGIVLTIQMAGVNHSHTFLYNGTLTDFRRALWNAHP